ncbi:unnamed protein product [Leuciscus chuanchicus]
MSHQTCRQQYMKKRSGGSALCQRVVDLILVTESTDQNQNQTRTRTRTRPELDQNQSSATAISSSSVTS